MTAAVQSAPIAAPRHRYRWAMLFGVWLAYFCFGLVATSLAPLLPPVSAELGLGPAEMGAVLGAWQLVYIGSAMPCGALLDRVGLRRGLLVAGLVIALSAALRALTGDFWTLFLAVAVFGLGGPLVSIGAPKLISQWFEGPERGFAMGFYVVGNALGAVAALSLTNAVMLPLLDGAWRGVLLTYAGFVLAAALAWFAIASHPASRALERRAAAEPRRPQTEVFADLLRLRAVRLVLAMSIGIFFFNHALNNWLPEILRSGGMTPAVAGYWASVPVVVGLVGALIIPRLAVPSRRFAILAALFLCAGGATLLIHGDGPLLATGLVLQGIARSSMMSVAVLLLIEARGVDLKNTGAAGGLFFAAAEIGGVLGPLTLGLVADATGGFAAGLNVLTGVCAVLLVLLWQLRRGEARLGQP